MFIAGKWESIPRLVALVLSDHRTSHAFVGKFSRGTFGHQYSSFGSTTAIRYDYVMIKHELLHRQHQVITSGKTYLD